MFNVSYSLPPFLAMAGFLCCFSEPLKVLSAPAGFYRQRFHHDLYLLYFCQINKKIISNHPFNDFFINAFIQRYSFIVVKFNIMNITDVVKHQQNIFIIFNITVDDDVFIQLNAEPQFVQVKQKESSLIVTEIDM